MPGPFNTKRYRKAMKTITYAAGGTDQIPTAGPYNEVIWDIKGTTPVHTANDSGQGIARWAQRVVVTSNKRGTLADFDSLLMLQLSHAFFNMGRETDTAGGSAADGAGGVLPIGCDADELITYTFTFGTLTDMSSDIASYTGVLRLEVAVINAPLAGVYWAYRKQILGLNGVIGVAGAFQQPTPPVVPGFFLCKELFCTFITSATTAIAMALEEVRVTQADDYLIDDYVYLLILAWNRRLYNNIRDILLTNHIPVVTSDVTMVYVVNGATATISPSEMCYIYFGGLISSGVGASGYRGEAVKAIPQTDTPLGGAGTPIQPIEPYTLPQITPTRVEQPGYREKPQVQVFGRRQ